MIFSQSLKFNAKQPAEMLLDFAWKVCSIICSNWTNLDRWSPAEIGWLPLRNRFQNRPAQEAADPRICFSSRQKRSHDDNKLKWSWMAPGSLKERNIPQAKHFVHNLAWKAMDSTHYGKRIGLTLQRDFSHFYGELFERWKISPQASSKDSSLLSLHCWAVCDTDFVWKSWQKQHGAVEIFLRHSERHLFIPASTQNLYSQFLIHTEGWCNQPRQVGWLFVTTMHLRPSLVFLRHLKGSFSGLRTQKFSIKGQTAGF